MTIQSLKAARIQDNELSLIGVDTSGIPTRSTFPRTFSKEGFSLWEGLLQSEWFKKLCTKEKSTSEVWFKTIREFMALCNKNGVLTFDGNTNSNNEVITTFLTDSRRCAASYFSKIELFTKLQVVRSMREFKFEVSSFTVTTVAGLRHREAVESVESWLVTPNNPGFKKEGDFLTKHLKANLNLFYKPATKKELAQLGITIFCHTPVRIPDLSQVPSRKKMAAYAEKFIWLPVVRATKFEGAGRFLF